MWRSGPTVGDEPHRCHSLPASRGDRAHPRLGASASRARSGRDGDVRGRPSAGESWPPARIARSFATRPARGARSPARRRRARAPRARPRRSRRSTAGPTAAPTRRTRRWSPTRTSTSCTSPRPHALHLEHARLAFEAGKHVLCEKPLTLNTAEAEEMVRLAREHDRFLMEAHVDGLPPGHPRAVRRAGERFGRRGRCTPTSASWSRPARTTGCSTRRLGAGALLDMGIYPLTFAHLCSARPGELRAVGGPSARRASTSTSRSPGGTPAGRPRR